MKRSKLVASDRRVGTKYKHFKVELRLSADFPSRVPPPHRTAADKLSNAATYDTDRSPNGYSVALGRFVRTCFPDSASSLGCA